MSATATLNVRLPEELKKHGGQVLDKNGLSVSDAIRGLYAYMQDHQCLPEFLEKECGESIYDRRRKLAQSMVGIVLLPAGLDAREVRTERLAQKYEEFL